MTTKKTVEERLDRLERAIDEMADTRQFGWNGAPAVSEIAADVRTGSLSYAAIIEEP
jgi:hypothetical protein